MQNYSFWADLLQFLNYLLCCNFCWVRSQCSTKLPEGSFLHVRRGRPAGGEALSSCRISFGKLLFCFLCLLTGSVHLSTVDHSEALRATCSGVLHFCFVWISKAELGSRRAFDETASWRKEAGSRSLLLSASLSLLELCEGWEQAWEGGSQGAGCKCHAQLGQLRSTPCGDNILWEKAPS